MIYGARGKNAADSVTEMCTSFASFGSLFRCDGSVNPTTIFSPFELFCLETISAPFTAQTGDKRIKSHTKTHFKFQDPPQTPHQVPRCDSYQVPCQVPHQVPLQLPSPTITLTPSHTSNLTFRLTPSPTSSPKSPVKSHTKFHYLRTAVTSFAYLN